MTKLLPAPLHRALLPLAHGLRHKWRRWRRKPIAGVSVVITNLGGDVLLLKHSYGPKVWTLPGGGLKRGEDPAEAARREVHEELGLTLTRIEPVAVIKEEISRAPHTAYLFAATCDQRPQPDQREIIEARFFPSHSLPEPLGRITRMRIDAWRARGTGK
jgi:ADP-ribose pyrophosphatase YjhB (NUDIX family)